MTYMRTAGANCFAERREGRGNLTVDRSAASRNFLGRDSPPPLARRGRAIFVWVCLEEDILVLWRGKTRHKLEGFFFARSQNCGKRPSLCLAVHLSTWNDSDPTRRNFLKFDIWVLFVKSVEKIQVPLKLGRNKWLLCLKINIHFRSYLSST
jgi:hypothetical protein